MISGPIRGVAWIAASLIVAVFIFLSLRYGILTFAAGIFFANFDGAVLTADLSSWYAGRSVMAFVVFAGLATYALVIALGRRSLLGESLLEARER